MDIEQQEDVSNSKDDENAANLTTNPGGAGDENINKTSTTDDSNTKEHSDESNINLDVTTPEKSNQLEVQGKNLESSEQALNENKLEDDKESKIEDNVTIDTSTNLLEEKNDLNEECKDDINESAMDDAESDFELVYENDEMENDLTDDALKLLDQELGIADDSKIVENVLKTDENSQEVTSEIKENQNLISENVCEISGNASITVENVPKQDEIGQEMTSNIQLEENDSPNDNSKINVCENDLKNDEGEQEIIVHDMKGQETKISENIEKNTQETKVTDVFDSEMNIGENCGDKNKQETVSKETTSITLDLETGTSQNDGNDTLDEVSHEHKTDIEDNNKAVEKLPVEIDLGLREKEAKLTDDSENIDENLDKEITELKEHVILDLNKEKWEDDKNETNIQLTDDALKKLDEELGISESNIVPTELITPNKEIITSTTEINAPSTNITEIITPATELTTPSTEITPPLIELTADGKELTKDSEMVDIDNQIDNIKDNNADVTPIVKEILPCDVEMGENLNTKTESKNVPSKNKLQEITPIDTVQVDDKRVVSNKELNKNETLIEDITNTENFDKESEIIPSQRNIEDNMEEDTSINESQFDKEITSNEILKTLDETSTTKLDDAAMDVDDTEFDKMDDNNQEKGEIQTEIPKDIETKDVTEKCIDEKDVTDKVVDETDVADKLIDEKDVTDRHIDDIDLTDKLIDEKEIKEEMDAKEDNTPKIRVLNVAEINHDNILNEGIDDLHLSQDKLNISVEKNNIIIDCTKTETSSENDEFVSPLDSTSKTNDKTIGIKTDHKINRPDVMLDIPTQELINFEDDDDSNDKNDSYSLTSKTVTEIVNQLEKNENLKDENEKETDNQSTTIDTSEINKNLEAEEIATENVKLDKDSKLTEDVKDIDKITEDTKMVEETDTLDLLAESSRIPDDDEEQEPEQDDDDGDGDADDDDEMDHDDESSNQMTTAEHSEDSNNDQPQEAEIQRSFSKVTDKSPQVIGEGETMDATDANVEGNASESNEDAEDILKNEEKVTEELEEILKSTKSTDVSTKKRRRSILQGLLSDIDGEESDSSKTKKTGSPTKQDPNVVDLEESDTEDDKKEGKKVKDSSTKVTKETEKSKDEDSGKDDEKSKEKDNKEMEEILNLDSDDEIIAQEMKQVKNNNCINNNCTSDVTVQYYKADKACKLYYNVKNSAAIVCQCCLEFVSQRNQDLVSGIKDMRPLIDLEMSPPPQQLVEISDSDSDDDGDKDDVIGQDTARLIEDQLDDLFNLSWRKYKMDDRLKDTEDYFRQELDKMEQQSKEVDELLKSCEKMTDKLRDDLYQQFEPKKYELPSVYIHDTPVASYWCPEKDEKTVTSETAFPPRYPKRQLSQQNTTETPPKKQALPKDVPPSEDQAKQDDDKDVSVVHLSAEEAPAELPPPGELTRAPLRGGMPVYAMKNSFGAWLRGTLLENVGKVNGYTQCRIKFDHKVRTTCKTLSARCIAYTEPSTARLTIGTRVVALFKNTESPEPRKDAYYSGVVAEIPNPVNNYRYLVFFDDGYAQYVPHQHTRLVAESSDQVWEEVHPFSRDFVYNYLYLVFFDDGYAQYVPHQHTRLVAESSDQVWEEVHPFSRDFVYNYLVKYPERPMVRMHKGQTISVELNGKWYDTRVVFVDASLVQVLFLEENRTEWIYRGSTRLRPLFVEFQAAKGATSRTRLPRTTRNTNKLNNVPYVEYTRSDEQTNKPVPQPTVQPTEEQRRLRAVAKKSTGPSPAPAPVLSDGVTSRVVYYTPKHAVRPHKLYPHSCGPRCRRTDVLSLKELRTYNPLAKPLLSGWERQIVRFRGHRAVMYRGPCGRRLRNMTELHRYLSAIRSDLSVDLFDFNTATHCLAEFVLTKYNVGKKDLSHGKENVPVACVNYYDTSLPEFCSYNTERTPTAGVPLNLDPEFLCGCDCVDDCVDKSKCACWQMTLEGAKTIGMDGDNIGYQFRRLLEPLPTGIYECNSRCKCKNTCLNRVVQHPLQLKLQVFKTINRGWGIRALNDVPKGAFLCIYAGNLLTDATANLDGLNEGDEYLAELDYIEVVEGMKEGYEEDVVEPDGAGDTKDKSSESEEESEGEKSDEEQSNDKEDGDFQPRNIGLGLAEFSKRLRRRDKKKKEHSKNGEKKDEANKKEGDDCITISDDDEVREPARFTVQEGMKDKKIVPKYKSIRDYFGEDEACYIMDAKVQGNIGRYLNHSCSPNVFVQNVFVDTHDPRFPWVSFFALHYIRAGTELTWNYNYDVGSVPGKVLYCFCGAPNCRGRLL